MSTALTKYERRNRERHPYFDMRVAFGSEMVQQPESNCPKRGIRARAMQKKRATIIGSPSPSCFTATCHDHSKRVLCCGRLTYHGPNA